MSLGGGSYEFQAEKADLRQVVLKQISTQDQE